MKPLKILHCAIFNEKTNAREYYSQDRKISHGLHQNGHFVYDFSYRDIERCLRKFGLKKFSEKKMNEKLIKVCKNLRPNVLLLGKAEKITIKTLSIIKNMIPDIKIGLWYVDHLEESNEWFDKFKEIDIFFHANAKFLHELSTRFNDTKFSFFPNICDESVEIYKDTPKTVDIIYIARDYKADTRYEFALLLDKFCKERNINYKIYASLGNECIFGADFFDALNSAKIAINFNRDDELKCEKSDKFLGASDRMAQFMGAGVCTFSPQIQGFDIFFKDGKEIIYFKNPLDCFKKIELILQSGEWKTIGENGRKAALNLANAKKVTSFMVEVLCEDKFSQDYEWSDLIYKNGVRFVPEFGEE